MLIEPEVLRFRRQGQGSEASVFARSPLAGAETILHESPAVTIHPGCWLLNGVRACVAPVALAVMPTNVFHRRETGVQEAAPSTGYRRPARVVARPPGLMGRPREPSLFPLG